MRGVVRAGYDRILMLSMIKKYYVFLCEKAIMKLTSQCTLKYSRKGSLFQL